MIEKGIIEEMASIRSKLTKKNLWNKKMDPENWPSACQVIGFKQFNPLLNYLESVFNEQETKFKNFLKLTKDKNFTEKIKNDFNVFFFQNIIKVTKRPNSKYKKIF